MFDDLKNLRHAFNVFLNRETTGPLSFNYGVSHSYRPDIPRLTMGTERSMVSSIYTRIAIDVAMTVLQHVRLDQNGRYAETIMSSLNECLSVEANIDQTGRNLLQDIVFSMFDEGHVAVVPVDTTINPAISNSYEIKSLRTGKILEWYPQHVRIDVYNDQKGIREEVVLPKRTVAIIENPLYAVMNEPNSTLKRLIAKLNLLDVIDTQSGSGKLDLIIQLPYVVKTPLRKQQAEDRRNDIQDQLINSRYGIAYTDASEKITQLNRPAVNNLMEQIEYLTRMLYGQLGISENVFNGTADEKEMTSYYNRTIDPVLTAIADSCTKAFITKTARTQGQAIVAIRNSFKLIPVSELGQIADSFTRNAILSSNDFRSILGYKPDKSPESDKLSNKNLNQPQPSVEKKPAEEETKQGVVVDGQK